MVLAEEYPAHPRWGEGPWLLCPKGPGTGSGDAPAEVTAQHCPLGSRLVARFPLGDLRITQETILWDGLDRVEFRTHVDGSIGQTGCCGSGSWRWYRAAPVFQCATAVVGRPSGWLTWTWADVTLTTRPASGSARGAARVSAGGHAWAIGVAR
jgi:hypothetical protein